MRWPLSAALRDNDGIHHRSVGSVVKLPSQSRHIDRKETHGVIPETVILIPALAPLVVCGGIILRHFIIAGPAADNQNGRTLAIACVITLAVYLKKTRLDGKGGPFLACLPACLRFLFKFV